MELDSLYQEVILDHYKNPLHKTLNSSYSAQVHHVNPSCGDEITLNVMIKNGLVESVSWEGVGCSISQASTSIASDLMIGKSMEDALKTVDTFSQLMSSKGTQTGDEDILEDGVALAGVSKFPARIKCALLDWMAFKDSDIQSKGYLRNKRNKGRDA